MRAQIPTFSLYGEPTTALDRLETVHIEDIPSRSSKYLGQISRHRHLTLSQCVVVTAGAATATLEETQSTFDGPMAVIVPEGTIHGFRFGAQTRGFVLTLSLEKLSSIATPMHRASIDPLFRAPCIIDLGLSAGLAARVISVLECLLSQTRQYKPPEVVAGWLACCALWTIAQGAMKSAASEACSGAEWELIRALRALVERHFTKHWAVARYARELGVAETSLNRLCRRLTGNSIFDLIQQRLALEARRELLYARGTISAIADSLGFRDSAYFSRFFRRHSGISPAEFRRKHGGGKVPNPMLFVQ
jgi:AraC family transcriptional regulator, transcriptional activator of pobA